MRALLLAALLGLSACASQAPEPSSHSLAIYPARLAADEGLRAMTDAHSGAELWLEEQPILTQGDIELAEVFTDPLGAPIVVLTLTPSAQALLANVTASRLGQPLAIVIDERLRLAPVIREPISDGRVALTGFDSLQEADALVDDWSR